MTNTIIIAISVLLIIAYIFDLSSARTKIPSVILLIILGWLVREATSLMGFPIMEFSSILQVFGIIGLILIVMEGGLDLELNRSKIGMVTKSFIGAFISVFVLSFLFAGILYLFMDYSLKDSLVNIIPLSIISSAIAIPGVRHCAPNQREFVTYESSLSDIIGVVVFNFVALNETIQWSTFGYFNLQLILMLFISFVAIIGLTLLLSRIKHHVKFFPIIILVILIYTISKHYHLPALIFIMLFGLFLGNIDLIRKYKWFEKLKPAALDREVIKFKELTFEASFLIRTLFFLLFGYLIDIAELANPATLGWAIGFIACIYLFRFLQLKISRMPVKPLIFIAPRGLITILLFLTIEPSIAIPLVNKSLIIQIIVITALIMMFGMIFTRPPKQIEEKTEPPKNPPVAKKPLILEEQQAPPDSF